MPTIVISICIFSLFDSIRVALNYSQFKLIFNYLILNFGVATQLKICLKKSCFSSFPSKTTVSLSLY